MKTLVKSNGSLIPGFSSLLDDIITGDIFEWPLRELPGSTTTPSVNIKETGNSYEMEVAAPGLDKNNFKVELDKDILVISGHKEMNREDKEENYTRKEFSYESFQRSFQIPEGTIEKEKISARYKDGILYVSIPKSNEAQAKSSRIIEIE